jgi:organic hydroperoxide reductase OsmC/OhrA
MRFGSEFMESFKKNSKNFKNIEQDRIDESVDESFPASDVPAWGGMEGSARKTSHEVALESKIKLAWERKTDDFDYAEYNRDASLSFEGGQEIQVSNPPQYLGDAKLPNAEELFVASVALCFMQTFLGVASLKGYVLKLYQGEAISKLDKNKAGSMSILEVILNIELTFEGVQPSEAALKEIQNRAHQHCFIANSIHSDMTVNLQLKK